jgi:hypothetical protein
MADGVGVKRGAVTAIEFTGTTFVGVVEGAGATIRSDA